jgi:uroporphyrinogen decarboxylase
LLPTSMTKRERVTAALNLGRPDRIPFVPAIYEHKAKLLGRSPSQVCRSAELLYQACRAEVALYDADMLVVGMDVYNVEAEALGCKVRYFDDALDVPGVTARPVDHVSRFLDLPLPEPEFSGRMPLFLDVGKRLQAELGNEMIIRGAVTGPFTLASEVCGLEALLYSALDDPVLCRRVLEHAAKVTVAFGAAFARQGVQPMLFDSRATPVLTSPRILTDLVAPVYREIVMPGLKQAGAWHIPLIIGGDTTSVLDSLVTSGATQLLCDFCADLSVFLTRCAGSRLPVRANVDPRLVAGGGEGEIRSAALRILAEGASYPGFLFGCGVVPYDCDPGRLLHLKQILEEGWDPGAESQTETPNSNHYDELGF